MSLIDLAASYIEQLVIDASRGMQGKYSNLFPDVACLEALDLLQHGGAGDNYFVDQVAQVVGLEPRIIYRVLLDRAQELSKPKTSRVYNQMAGRFVASSKVTTSKVMTGGLESFIKLAVVVARRNYYEHFPTNDDRYQSARLVALEVYQELGEGQPVRIVCGSINKRLRREVKNYCSYKSLLNCKELQQIS